MTILGLQTIKMAKDKGPFGLQILHHLQGNQLLIKQSLAFFQGQINKNGFISGGLILRLVIGTNKKVKEVLQ